MTLREGLQIFLYACVELVLLVAIFVLISTAAYKETSISNLFLLLASFVLIVESIVIEERMRPIVEKLLTTLGR